MPAWIGKHELGTEHDDADELMLWKWEPRDLRTLPKGYAAAGKALKKRLAEVRRCASLHRALAHLICPAYWDAAVVHWRANLPTPQPMWRAQGNKELKLLAAAHGVLAASIKGKGLNKRGAETLEKLNKFQKKTADDAPGRGGDPEPASGTARSASSTPTKKQAEPGSQVRRLFSRLVGCHAAGNYNNIIASGHDAGTWWTHWCQKLARRGDMERCMARIHLDMKH